MCSQTPACVNSSSKEVGGVEMSSCNNLYIIVSNHCKWAGDGNLTCKAQSIWKLNAYQCIMTGMHYIYAFISEILD